VAVARTLLAKSDVLLIDEPTAHLDEQAATALLADVRAATSDKITVLVTHQPTGIAPDDRRLSLGVTQPNSRAGVVLGA
jgi:ATP-binding cassette subfamily C protein CydCD